MNRRALLRTATPIVLIVLSTGTADDCEGVRQERSSQYSSRVEVRADDGTCWKVAVDGRTHSGCGDATFYGHEPSGSDHRARVQKVEGGSTVRASLVVDGRTVDRGTVRSSGQSVTVRQEVRSG